MTTYYRFFLFIIICISFCFRVYKVDQIPPSLSWDEVSIGYNGYSILKTGKDEHGRLLPLDTFIAYGDYKPPIPIYITVPFIAFFGLNEFSVRIPSVLFGTATVALTYVLVLELFSSHKKKYTLALLSSFVLGISPWHVNLSRVGFEAVIALFFIVLATVLFLLARSRSTIWYGVFLPFVAAVYTFNSARYFSPMFLLFLLWYTKEYAWKERKKVAIGWMIGVFALLPILPHLLSPEARLRYKEVNIFSNVDIVRTANQRIEQAGNTMWARIIHNRRIYYAMEFAKHYLDHFEPRFLFIKGDGNPKFSIQDVGQLYIIEIPFLVVGFFGVLLRYKKVGILLLLWLLLAVIPAGVARETPHALRILNTLPTWHIWIAYGIVYVLFEQKHVLVSFSSRIFVIFGYGFFIMYYLHNYYAHYPIEYSGEWQYGYREAFRFSESVKDKYQKIVVSDVIGRPYAYALFYGAYDPREFWRTKHAYFDAVGFYTVKGFGSYEFVRHNPESYEQNTLYILPLIEVPQGSKEVFRVRLLNGESRLVGFHL